MMFLCVKSPTLSHDYNDNQFCIYIRRAFNHREALCLECQRYLQLLAQLFLLVETLMSRNEMEHGSEKKQVLRWPLKFGMKTFLSSVN